MVELVTSLLPWACDAAAEAGAIPVLYDFLESLNKSEPHLDMANTTLQILLYLIRYQKTSHLAVETTCFLDVLLDRMVAFKEKPFLMLKVLKLIYLSCCHKSQFVDLLKENQVVLKRLHALGSAKPHKIKGQELNAHKRCAELISRILGLLS